MYKTPELPGAPPPGPHPLWARLRKRSLTIFPLSNLVPPPPLAYWLVGGGGSPAPQINLNHGLFSIPLFPYKWLLIFVSSSRNFLLRYALDCTFSSRKIKKLPTVGGGGGDRLPHPPPPPPRQRRRSWGAVAPPPQWKYWGGQTYRFAPPIILPTWKNSYLMQE